MLRIFRFFKVRNNFRENFSLLFLLLLLCYTADISDGRYYPNVNKLRRDFLKPFRSYLNEEAVFYCPIRTKNDEIVIIKKREAQNPPNNTDFDNVEYIIENQNKALSKRNAEVNENFDDDNPNEIDENYANSDYDTYEKNSINDQNEKIYNLKDMLLSIKSDIDSFGKDKLIKYAKRNIKDGLEKLKMRNCMHRRKLESHKSGEGRLIKPNAFSKFRENNNHEIPSVSSIDNNLNDYDNINENKSNNRYRPTRYLKNLGMTYDRYYGRKTTSSSKLNEISNIKKNKNIFINQLNKDLTSTLLNGMVSKHSDLHFMNLLNSFANNNKNNNTSSTDSINVLLTGLNSFFGSNDNNNSDKKSLLHNEVKNINVGTKFFNSTYDQTKIIPLVATANYRKSHTVDGKLNLSFINKQNNSEISAKNKLMTNNSLNQCHHYDFEVSKRKDNNIKSTTGKNFYSSGGGKYYNTEVMGKYKSPLFDFPKKAVSKIKKNFFNENVDSAIFSTQNDVKLLKDKYDVNNNNVSRSTVSYIDGRGFTDDKIYLHTFDTDDNNLQVDHVNENNAKNTSDSVNSYNTITTTSDSVNTDLTLTLNNIKFKKVRPDQFFMKKLNYLTPLFLKYSASTLSSLKTMAQNRIESYNMHIKPNSQDKINNEKSYNMFFNRDNVDISGNNCSNLTNFNDDTDNNQQGLPLLKNITVNLTCADVIKVNATFNFNYENNNCVESSIPSVITSSKLVCSHSTKRQCLTSTPNQDISCLTFPFKTSYNDNENDYDNYDFTTPKTKNTVTSCNILPNRLITASTLNPCATWEANFVINDKLTTININNPDDSRNGVLRYSVEHNINYNNSNNNDNDDDMNDNNGNEKSYTRNLNQERKKYVITTTTTAISNKKIGDLNLKIMVQNVSNAGGRNEFDQSSLAANNEVDDMKNCKKDLKTGVENKKKSSGVCDKNSTDTCPKKMNRFEDDYEDEDYNRTTPSTTTTYRTILV